MASDAALRAAGQPAQVGALDGAHAILRAATELFSERGFDAVPLSAIAERAHVSKGNIFHHFGSKELLYMAVLREACANTARLVNELTTGAGDFAQRIRHFAFAHLQHLTSHHDVSRLILREFLEGGTHRGRALVEHVYGENFTKLVGIFQLGQRQGAVRPDLDPAALALALLAGNIFFFQVQPLLPHLPLARSICNPELYSEAVIEVFLRGVLTESRQREERRRP